MAELDDTTKRLMEWRWSGGLPICPYCEYDQSYWCDTTRADRFKCKRCLRRYSITQGTLFHKTKLSPHQVLRAIELLAEPTWPSIGYFANALGVSYTSAWFLYTKATDRPRLSTEGIGAPGKRAAYERGKLDGSATAARRIEELEEQLRQNIARLEQAEEAAYQRGLAEGRSQSEKPRFESIMTRIARPYANRDGSRRVVEVYSGAGASSLGGVF